MRTLIACFVALAAVACAKSQPARPATTTTTSAAVPVTPYETAIRNISVERCNRERACANVGTGKRFATFDVCTRDVEKKTRAGLQAKDCPNGVKDVDLNACLGELRTERCADVSKSVESVGACKQANLCR